MSGEESPGYLRINILPPASANNWTNNCSNDSELGEKQTKLQKAEYN